MISRAVAERPTGAEPREERPVRRHRLVGRGALELGTGASGGGGGGRRGVAGRVPPRVPRAHPCARAAHACALARTPA